jgi:hypothetical protein
MYPFLATLLYFGIMGGLIGAAQHIFSQPGTRLPVGVCASSVERLSYMRTSMLGISRPALRCWPAVAGRFDLVHPGARLWRWDDAHMA